jgi:hypothetical protein
VLYTATAMLSAVSAMFEWWNGSATAAVRGLLFAVVFALLAVTAGRPQRGAAAAVVVCLAAALALAIRSWLS